MARPSCKYRGRDPAPRPKFAFYLSPDRLRALHHILQNTIHRVLLKDTQVAVALQIFLIRLEFETQFAGLVPQRDHTEIGQAGFGADGSELRIVDDDLVSGKLVWPGLNLRELGFQACSGVLSGVALLFWHENIVMARPKLDPLASGKRRSLKRPPPINPHPAYASGI